MFSKDHEKMARHCPACGGVVNPSRAELIQYVLSYRPFHCEHCATAFDVNNISKILMLFMASIVVFLAMRIEALREFQKSEPNLEFYLLAGTILVTCVVALIMMKNRDFIVRDEQRPGAALLHYATLAMMPLSLLLFAYMAKLHAV